MISRPAIRVLLIEDSPTDSELIQIGLEDVRTAQPSFSSKPLSRLPRALSAFA